MKKIFFVYGRKLSELPPLITLLEMLGSKGYTCSVLVSEIETQYDAIADQILIGTLLSDSGRISRAINRRYQKYLFAARNIPMLAREYDVVWHVLASGTVELNTSIPKGAFADKATICSVYELFDNSPETLKKISPIVKTAAAVVMPEYNRANIYRAWFGLSDLPIVLPNAPLTLPILEDGDIIERLHSHKDKIILYQGHIMRIRNLDALCDAISQLQGFELVLMGKSHQGYAEELMSKYEFVSHIPFINPPKHLQFTSGAYIGVVTYGSHLLNGVYCAPNKIWEYSGYGVPMICNDIPGLKYTVEASGSGLCTDMSDSAAIKDALLTLDVDHDAYVQRSLRMFESLNLEIIVDKILAAI